MKDWEKYEVQIFDKFAELFPDAEILKNQRVIGRYSNRSRQVDILIKSRSVGREFIIIIDCKKFSKKIDIKTVESFIGFSEDVGAHVGILVTNIGYSKSANARAKNHHKDIQLDVVEFDKLEDYEFHFDYCFVCENEKGNLLGLIKWEAPLPMIEDGVVTLFHLGNCLKCKEHFIKCQGCGQMIRLGLEETECNCDFVFNLENGKDGDTKADKYLRVRNKKEPLPEFINPNQPKLF